ncbi:MAG: hypothetical protein AWT59_3153 [Candidatus Gallionella acididurans]|uniref:Uncharacterized protein n=1 Tax=Candidatus Gallionella acididurans TaxID=1796491 RepID=A0A139BPI8_9PROT|nr:MAG: hypothetical protein AWT59_3153 [Candidatus Gallionella acididurans]
MADQVRADKRYSSGRCRNQVSTIKNSPGPSLVGKLGLEAKVQMAVHTFILVLFTIATLVLSHFMKTIVLDSVLRAWELPTHYFQVYRE